MPENHVVPFWEKWWNTRAWKKITSYLFEKANSSKEVLKDGERWSAKVKSGEKAQFARHTWVFRAWYPHGVAEYSSFQSFSNDIRISTKDGYAGNKAGQITEHLLHWSLRYPKKNSCSICPCACMSAASNGSTWRAKARDYLTCCSIRFQKSNRLHRI